MRHRKRGRQLSRNTSHRLAMRRNMACSLLLHGRIRTTPQKAKETAPLVEKVITLAKDGQSLVRFRRALALLNRKDIVRKLFREIGPTFADREGGYTRILPLSSSENRLGDNAPQVIFELVEAGPAGKEQAAKPKASISERIRQRLRGGAGPAEEKAPAEPEPEAEAPAEEPEAPSNDQSAPPVAEESEQQAPQESPDAAGADPQDKTG